MSNKAIGTDGREHFADDFRDSYSGDYFCPNPSCCVRLKRKNLGSDQKTYGVRRPYFSANRSTPHIEGCAYAKSCVSYERLNATGFFAGSFFHGLQTGYINTLKRAPATEDIEDPLTRQNTITTLNKLYRYCLQHRDEDVLPDGTKIFEIFQDDRNKSIPNWKRHTSKMVKLRFINCNFKDFDTKKYCWKLWCLFPHTEKTKPPGIYYTLGFREDSDSLMRYFCKILTPLKERNEDVFLLVGGEWKSNHCYINSKRQIFILPLHSS